MLLLHGLLHARPLPPLSPPVTHRPLSPVQRYLSPAFKLSAAEFEAFLLEADTMRHFLATGEQSEELEVCVGHTHLKLTSLRGL